MKNEYTVDTYPQNPRDQSCEYFTSLKAAAEAARDTLGCEWANDTTVVVVKKNGQEVARGETGVRLRWSR